MVILTLEIRLHAPWCRSLKDKRSVVKPLLAKLRAKFNVSAAEIDAQNQWTLLVLGVAAIAADAAQADSIAERVLSFAQANTQAEILSVQRELL
jgi:uncharacterized protein YlxP (DUF503 family)